MMVWQWQHVGPYGGSTGRVSLGFPSSYVRLYIQTEWSCNSLLLTNHPCPRLPKLEASSFLPPSLEHVYTKAALTLHRTVLTVFIEPGAQSQPGGIVFSLIHMALCMASVCMLWLSWHHTIEEQWIMLPWWLSGKESTCQQRRHRFNAWSGKILPSAEQLSPVHHNYRACALEPRSHNSWAHMPYNPSPQQEKPL